MSLVFEGNTTAVSHNGKWSQWDLEPGYLTLIRTCCKAALIASTVDIKFSGHRSVMVRDASLQQQAPSRLFFKTSLYSEEYEVILFQASFSLSYCYPLFNLSCLFLLAIYFQARVLWREMKSLIAVLVFVCWEKKIKHFVFHSGTSWQEMNFLTSASQHFLCTIP